MVSIFLAKLFLLLCVKYSYFCKNSFLVRLVEYNDWVIFSLLACAFVYAIMFITLLRGIRIGEFFVMEVEDAPNSFLVWVITSLVYTVVFSVFVSQYVPIVPEQIAGLQLGGYQINKVGYSFLCISSFYIAKLILTYLYYSAVGNSRKWKLFYFTVTRFYYVLSLVLMAACIVHYYFNIDKHEMLKYYVLVFIIVFIFKQFLYLFHVNKILPERWYYKILYICTLQIVPLFALWKVLFY